MDYFPPIDERLIAALGTKFPDQSPDISMSEKEVWFAAGRAAVVRWLALKLEEQQQQNLEGL